MRAILLCVVLVTSSVFSRPSRNISSSFLLRRNGEAVNNVANLEQRLDEIQEDLQRIKLALFTSNNKDSLDLRVLKCAAELSNGSEQGASKYWQDLQMYLATQEQAKQIATRIIQRVDLQDSKSVLPLIQFFQFMNVPQAYGSLISKLRESGHFYASTSVVLAENIKQACGIEQSVFTSLPQALRDITGSVVSLKNVFNGGFLYLQNEADNVFTWFSSYKHVDLMHGMSEQTIQLPMWLNNYDYREQTHKLIGHKM